MFSNSTPWLVRNPGADVAYEFNDPYGLPGVRKFHHFPRFGVEQDVIDMPWDDWGREGSRRRYDTRGRGFNPEERAKRLMLCFTLAVVVVLLLGVAVLFPAIFLSAQPTASETAAMTPEIEFVGGIVTFDLPYIPAYNDKTSTEYQELAQNFVAEMDNLFGSDAGYLQTVVHDVTPGSIRIHFESIYTQATNVNILFKELFRERLEARAQVGTLGSFVFVSFTLVVFDVCNLYCFNGGVVNRDINVCACSCPEGFPPPSCEAPTATVQPTHTVTTEMSLTSGMSTESVTATDLLGGLTTVNPTTDSPTTTANPTTDSPTTTVNPTTDSPTTTEPQPLQDTTTNTESPTTAPPPGFGLFP